MFNDMMRAEIWLQERLETQHGIEDLAQHLGYSASQLRRNFKRCFGFSPSAYRDRLRLERAALLLCCTEYSIHEIALKCGYRNHSAFSRAFTRRYYQNPREYRHQARWRRDKLRQQSLHRSYPFHISHSQPQQAVVTRLYGQIRGNTCSFGDLARHAPLNVLPEKLLGNGHTIAIVHPSDCQEAFSYADVGVQVHADIANEMATPLLFRTLALSPCRYASVETADLNELPRIIEFLLAKALPEKGELASGQPLRLVWHAQPNADGNASSVEIQLPLETP